MKGLKLVEVPLISNTSAKVPLCYGPTVFLIKRLEKLRHIRKRMYSNDVSFKETTKHTQAEEKYLVCTISSTALHWIAFACPRTQLVINFAIFPIMLSAEAIFAVLQSKVCEAFVLKCACSDTFLLRNGLDLDRSWKVMSLRIVLIAS